MTKLSLTVLTCLFFLSSCQKDKDILNRIISAEFQPEMLTTIFADGNGRTQKDTIFWYQDAQGRIDSAYQYDSASRKRMKVLHVDRTAPGMTTINDGEENMYHAKILFNGKKQPYKVIFYFTPTSTRLSNSYNFFYGNNIRPNGLEVYMDSVYASLTIESYGFMSSGSAYNYPMDSFEKISTKSGFYLYGDLVNNMKRGTDISRFSFVPFISTTVTSNLGNMTPTTINRDIFDAYIWGEVMRPWLSPNIILSFDDWQFYPTYLSPQTYAYTAQIHSRKIIYSDGERTIQNYYP